MRLVFVLLWLFPAVAAASITRATFDIYVAGLRAGVVSIAGEEGEGRYAAAGRLESVGIIGAFRKVRYDAEVRGRVEGSAFAPRRYSETYKKGRDVNEKSIEYRKGVPRIQPKKARGRLDPTEQHDTFDPLTAIWGLLRDVPESEVCRFSGDLFDGEKRSRVVLGAPRRESGAMTCAGEYRRIAGYDKNEMKDASYPFRMRYVPAGDGRWQVERIDMESIFGRGAIVRR